MVIILTIKEFVKADGFAIMLREGKGKGRLEDRADHGKFKQDNREGESL
jgi:hypothetical protein